MDDYQDTLGAGSYPSPYEEKEREVTGTVVLTYKIKANFPDSWNQNDIEEALENYLFDYIDYKNFDDMELDI